MLVYEIRLPEEIVSTLGVSSSIERPPGDPKERLLGSPNSDTPGIPKLSETPGVPKLP